MICLFRKDLRLEEFLGVNNHHLVFVNIEDEEKKRIYYPPKKAGLINLQNILLENSSPINCVNSHSLVGKYLLLLNQEENLNFDWNSFSNFLVLSICEMQSFYVGEWAKWFIRKISGLATSHSHLAQSLTTHLYAVPDKKSWAGRQF